MDNQTSAAQGTGLGVAGVNFASPSSAPSPSSASNSKAPRWGTIRQRFSSIQSRDSPPVPVDSVDDGMWDKNDTAFLEEVARDSPLLLSSPDRFDSLAPVFEDTYTGRASLSSSRIHSFVRANDAESSSHRYSMQHRPSSASSSTPSSAASAASPLSTPVVTYDEMSGSSAGLASGKPWPRSMRRMASATVLPGLPEQNSADTFTRPSLPSTSSSSGIHASLPYMSPPLLPSVGSASSFMAMSSSGNRRSRESSLRSSPSMPHSVHAGSDSARSATAEQYPRSPSLHSSSSFTASGANLRSNEDRVVYAANGRTRTLSYNSKTSFNPSTSTVGLDRRTSRSIVGIPLAPRGSFSSTRPPGADAVSKGDASIAASPILSHVATEHGSMAFLSGRNRQSSVASVADLPQPDGAKGFDGQAMAAAWGKREASASMKGVPGTPTKKNRSAIAPAPTSMAPPSAEAPNTLIRKHTKNKSSLVSGLRKLMGKREQESAGIMTISDPIMTDNSDLSSAVIEASASAHSDATAARHPLRSRAMSIDDAHHQKGLNLLGLSPDAFGSDDTVEASQARKQSISSQSGVKDSVGASGPTSMSRKSPSLDLLRSFGSKGKVPQVDRSNSAADEHATAPLPHSRTKSSDGILTKPLRDVLGQRTRKNTANRASVIEHTSFDEARRLTCNAGPVFLPTKEALEEHRSKYATFPAEIGLPDRATFDVHHDPTRMTEVVPSESRASTHSPLRPQRPMEASAFGAEPIELLTPSKSGEAANANSHDHHHNNNNVGNVGGVSSSGSSFVSASSNTTDPSTTARGPFAFQSQTYRPFSRESQRSSQTQLSPPSSPASQGFCPNGDPNSHRTIPSFGSHSALFPLHDGQALQQPEWGAATMMPPPAGVKTAKRNHNSRRSLSSLVGSKPWSGFGSATSFGSSHHKQVSVASISRPMSVSSSAFSNDLNDLSADVADLTLRPSDFGNARLRMRVDSTPSDFSEPGFKGWQPVTTVGPNLRNSPNGYSHSSTHHVALAPPASSNSSHSHQSHRSSQSLSHLSSFTASASVSSVHLAPAIPNASHRLIPTSIRRPATSDDASPVLNSSGSFQASTTAAPSVSSPLIRSSSFKVLDETRASSSFTGDDTLLPGVTAAPSLAPPAPGFSSRPRPPGAGHRASTSGSSLSHRKRPSFGLAIEPAAHSAFDSIPSPLLRTRRISLAQPEGAPQRPISTSSASAGRTPSGSSPGTSFAGSARVSAATFASSHDLGAEDHVEIETLRDGSPTKRISHLKSGPLLADPVLIKPSESDLDSEMGPASNHRHSVSVPVDEGDSPRRDQEESWTRATGGEVLTYGAMDEPHHHMQEQQTAPEPRQYMIHSPSEEGELPSSPGRLSQATKDIAFGSIAGMVSKVFEHPFDLVKVRLQTQSADRPPRYAGAFDCFKQTYLQEGIRGLYRGLSMPVIGATLENACLFFTYNQIQSAIRWANGEASSRSAAKADAESPLSIPQLGIAAAGAGAVTSLVLTPIELIKCKMQVQMITRGQHGPVSSAIASAGSAGTKLGQQRSLYTSAIARSAAASSSSAAAFKSLDGPLTLFRRTIATDGIRGLWLGQTGTLLRETGGGIAWFLAFESCSRYLIARKKALWKRDDVTKKDLTSLELVGSGALAGISYNVVLFPADCVKSTMQTEQEMRAATSTAKAGEKWKGTGFYDTFKKIYRTRGIRGLYAGCGVTCLRSAPSSAIIFLMYNKLEKLSDEYGL